MAQTPTPVIRRTVYYVQPKGKQVRFTGFATVTTSLGSMFEPFGIDQHAPGEGILDYDPSDPMARIDRLQQIASEDSLFYDGDKLNRKRLHGGRGLNGPSVLIRSGNFAD